MQVVPQADRVLIRLEELSDVCYTLILKTKFFYMGCCLFLILWYIRFQQLVILPFGALNFGNLELLACFWLLWSLSECWTRFIVLYLGNLHFDVILRNPLRLCHEGKFMVTVFQQ